MLRSASCSRLFFLGNLDLSEHVLANDQAEVSEGFEDTRIVGFDRHGEIPYGKAGGLRSDIPIRCTGSLDHVD